MARPLPMCLDGFFLPCTKEKAVMIIWLHNTCRLHRTARVYKTLPCEILETMQCMDVYSL